MTHIGLLAFICAVLLLSIAAAWGAIAFASGALGAVNPSLILAPFPSVPVLAHEFACVVEQDWWPEVTGTALAVAVFCLWTMTSAV